MTAEEFKERSKVYLIKKLAFDEPKAAEMAQAVFDNQDGPFIEAESAGYSPEACCDEEISCWEL